MRVTATTNLVWRLLTLEATEGQQQEGQQQEAMTAAAESVLDKLRVHLSNRIGQEGFRVLLARALTLATAQFPHLSAVRVAADGSLVGLRRAVGADLHDLQKTPDNGAQQNNVGQQEAVAGVTALMAHLLGLLIAFIGEDLTLRVLGSVSPEFDSSEAMPERELGSVFNGEKINGEKINGENERP